MNELMNKVLHHRVFVPAVVGVGSVSAGLGVGYALGKYIADKRWTVIVKKMLEDERQLTLPLDDETNQFVTRAEGWYVQMSQDNMRAASMAHHPSVIRPPLDVVEEPDPVEEVKVVRLEHKPDIVPPRTNVFRAAQEWDQEAEEAQRSEDTPYIISKDEFFANERADDGYLQEDMVYYEGDDILTDSDDVPQYDHPRMVGELRFGHGSGEESVVYVRNPMLKMEYAISRDPGSYEHEVLGDTMSREEPDPPLRFRE